jgi:hypothetical protein
MIGSVLVSVIAIATFGCANADMSMSTGGASASANGDMMECSGCVATLEQCGDAQNATLSCCDPDAMCISKNSYYAQCLSSADVEAHMTYPDWDGSVVECGEEPIPDLTPQKAADPVCVSAGVTECAADYDQCGGYSFGVTLPCCHEGYECVNKNGAFAQCIPMARIARNVASGWDGSIVACDGSLAPAPMTTP